MLHAADGRQHSRRGAPYDVTRWDEHIDRHGIANNGRIFFSRPAIPLGGHGNGIQREPDLRKPASSQAMRHGITRISEAVHHQLGPDLRPTFDLHPKILRRTFACLALIAHAIGVGGMDVHTLQRAMGHESLDTTASYLNDVAGYINATREHYDAEAAARAISAARRAMPQTPDRPR